MAANVSVVKIIIKIEKKHMEKLKKNELNQLKGGIYGFNDDNSQLLETPGDVINSNSVRTCICVYTDAGVTTNTNKVDGCTCSCKKPV